MAYIEGFIVAVPEKNKSAYLEQATGAVPLFTKLGATRMVETWADDVPDGKVTDFKRAVKAKPDEAVLFSWVEYPDKATRDQANKHLMDEMKDNFKDMPFDGQRMVFGGFEPINDTGKANKPGYVDGCVIPVPTRNKQDYVEMADKHAMILKEYGATRVVDAWSDDVPDGKVTDFKGAVAREDGEHVVYSWIEWPSKEVRDAGWKKFMEDPRVKDTKMPFDGKRLIYGGFQPILDTLN